MRVKALPWDRELHQAAYKAFSVLWDPGQQQMSASSFLHAGSALFLRKSFSSNQSSLFLKPELIPEVDNQMGHLIHLGAWRIP